MLNLSIPLPETAFSALHLGPDAFAREMRVAAAIQWYAQARISQNKAAEIAGLSRADFIRALSDARVSAFQVTAESLHDARNCPMRIDRVVVNSSSLITLFNSGQAELLPQLFSEVLVPDAGWLEVAESGHQDMASLVVIPAKAGIQEIQRTGPRLSPG